MKKKSMLIVAIILMSIGFAAISTTLILNGNANVSENNEDFSVIFTAASIDGNDVYTTAVDETKKIITFETSELKTLNQTSILTYEVTNNSSNYDAKVTVTCVPKTGTTAKYTSIKNKLENDATVIKAKSSVNGTLTVTLDKVAIESVIEEYTCKLEFNAVERDTLASSGQYYAYGTPTTASATDYTTLGKNVFVRLGTDGSRSVCINDNGLFCIKINDYDNSVLALTNHFGNSACTDLDSSFGRFFQCESEAFECTAYSSSGIVNCQSASAGENCTVSSSGTVACS
jgi:hypothetical protein